MSSAQGQGLWLYEIELRAWSKVGWELKQGNAFVFLPVFRPKVVPGFVAHFCDSLLSWWYLTPKYLRSLLRQFTTQSWGSWVSVFWCTPWIHWRSHGGISSRSHIWERTLESKQAGRLQLVETDDASLWICSNIVNALHKYICKHPGMVLGEKNHSAWTDSCF